jgi:hypothetical protein
MTVGDAYKANLIAEDDLAAATSAYLADPSKPARLAVAGSEVDVASAILTSPYAVDVLAQEDATAGQRRTAIRTAVLLARVG